MKLSPPQRRVLEQMVHGAVLFVRLEPGDPGLREVCWIGELELPPMTVNALIAARLIEPEDPASGTGRSRTVAYGMSYAGRQAVLGA